MGCGYVCVWGGGGQEIQTLTEKGPLKLMS